MPRPEQENRLQWHVGGKNHDQVFDNNDELVEELSIKNRTQRQLAAQRIAEEHNAGLTRADLAKITREHKAKQTKRN